MAALRPAPPSAPKEFFMAAQTWTLDPVHSSINFWVRHLMVSKVHGRFGAWSGSLVFDEAAPESARVEVTIDATSIDTREPQRDGHLRSADFLDVETFPHLTFKSKRIADRRGDEFTLAGDLTIHGVTREVTLHVTDEGRGKDPWGGERAGFSADTKINRKDYGLNWNQAL